MRRLRQQTTGGHPVVVGHPIFRSQPGVAVRSLTHIPWYKSIFGVIFVPETNAYIVERFNKYKKTMYPGIGFVVPFVERMAYIKLLNFDSTSVHEMYVDTQDGFKILVNATVHFQVKDPVLASYMVNHHFSATTEAAKETLLSEFSRQTLEESFWNQCNLDASILRSINEKTMKWGVSCYSFSMDMLSYYRITETKPIPGALGMKFRNSNGHSNGTGGNGHSNGGVPMITPYSTLIPPLNGSPKV